MQESPIYQEIIQKGVQQVVQQGKQDIVMRQLTRRMGTISPQSQAQIQKLSSQQLDQLSEALLDFSDPTDLTIWLQSQPRIHWHKVYPPQGKTGIKTVIGKRKKSSTMAKS